MGIHWYLVMYDVRDDTRLRRVQRIVDGYGERLQYSVYRARCHQREIMRMQWELEQVMEDRDDLLIVRLCPGCASRIVHRTSEPWSPTLPAYTWIGEDSEPDGRAPGRQPPDQAPPPERPARKKPRR